MGYHYVPLNDLKTILKGKTTPPFLPSLTGLTFNMDPGTVCGLGFVKFGTHKGLLEKHDKKKETINYK